MKHIATTTLMFTLGGRRIITKKKQVKMTVSGTNVATTINLQPGTITDEVNFSGDGTLGPFTYRELHADTLSPQSSSTCVGGNGLYVPTLTGAGVFQFRDGSLLSIGSQTEPFASTSQRGWPTLLGLIRSQVEPDVSRVRPAPLR